MDKTNKLKGIALSLFVLMAMGFLSAFLSINLVRLPDKYFFAVFAGFIILGILFALNSRESIYNFLLAAFALSIPINLDINFFYRAHEGGAPGITVSLSIVIVFMLLLYVFMGRVFSADGFKLRFSLAIPVLLYMVSGFLSLVNSLYLNLVLFEQFRFFMLLAVLLLASNIKTVYHLKIFLACLCVTVMGQAILAIIQYKTGKNLGLSIFGEEQLVSQFLGYHFQRATGTIGHPNILAYYFEILLPLVFALLLTSRGMLKTLFLTAVLLTGCMGMIVTLSRASWMASSISFTMVFLVLYRKKIFEYKTMIMAVSLLLFAIIPLYFSYPIIEKRLLHKDYGSAAARMPLNEATFSLIKKFPVVGAGMNNFAEVFRKYDTTGKSKILKSGKNVVHNMYLLIWAEVGTLGLIAFILFVFNAFKLAFQTYSRVPYHLKAVLVGICAGITAHLVHGFFDPGFKTNFPVSTLLFSLVGVIGSVSLLHPDAVEGDETESYAAG